MVKRFDGLFDRLTSFENLRRAFRKAARGKRGNPEVAGFEFYLEGHLFSLQAELRAQSYLPGAYRSFYIRDPKRRLISAAPFRDRVVHHAVCNLIEPIFEATFIHDSYANRAGKGTHAALGRAQGFARQHPFVLQGDIRQFFPSIDHQILQGLLARKIADVRVMDLCAKILAGGGGILQEEYEMVYFPGDDLLAALRWRGLPIGNLTSQFWANVYLNELDQFVKRELRVRAYVRYVDDFLLFADQKPILWEWKAAICERLQGLRLTLHDRSSTVYPVSNGIPFLGLRLYPTHRRLKRRNGVAFQRRFRRLRAQYAGGQIDKEHLDRAVQGWVAHAAHADAYGLRRAILGAPIPPIRR
jgi:retron-type reverse transcriptase